MIHGNSRILGLLAVIEVATCKRLEWKRSSCSFFSGKLGGAGLFGGQLKGPIGALLQAARDEQERRTAGPPPEWDGVPTEFKAYKLKARIWLRTRTTADRRPWSFRAFKVLFDDFECVITMVLTVNVFFWSFHGAVPCRNGKIDGFTTARSQFWRFWKTTKLLSSRIHFLFIFWSQQRF